MKNAIGMFCCLTIAVSCGLTDREAVNSTGPESSEPEVADSGNDVPPPGSIEPDFENAVELSLLANPVSPTSTTPPCPSWAGLTAHPDYGTGRCSGNLTTVIPLPTTKGALVHNSRAAQPSDKFGFSAGWNLTFRNEIFRNGLSLTLRHGDGGQIILTSTSQNGPWKSTDLRLSRAVVRLLSDGRLEQDSPGGLTVTFVQSTIPGRYVIQSISDGNGNSTTVTRSATAEVWKSSFGQKTTLSIANGLITSIVDPSNNAYELTYTGGRLTGVANPDGSKWSIEYAPSGDLIGGIISPTGLRTQYAYFAEGILRAVVDHFNWTTNFSYSATAVTATSSFGITIETFVNQQGKAGLTQIEQLNPQRSVSYKSSFVRDTRLRLTQSTDFFGRLTTYSYSDTNPNLDTSIFPTQVNSPSGKTEFVYDTNGNPVKVTETFGAKSEIKQFVYDSEQRLVAVTLNGVTRKLHRDAAGNQTGTSLGENPALEIVSFDSRGLPIQARNQYGQTSLVSYSANGQIASITDTNKVTTTFSSDAAGIITAVNKAGMLVSTIGYDKMNRFANQIEARLLSDSVAKKISAYQTTQLSAGGTQVLAEHYINSTLSSASLANYYPWGDVKSVKQTGFNGTTTGFGLTGGSGIEINQGDSCSVNPSPVPPPPTTVTTTRAPTTTTRVPTTTRTPATTTLAPTTTKAAGQNYDYYIAYTHDLYGPTGLNFATGINVFRATSATSSVNVAYNTGDAGSQVNVNDQVAGFSIRLSIIAKSGSTYTVGVVISRNSDMKTVFNKTFSQPTDGLTGFIPGLPTQTNSLVEKFTVSSIGPSPSPSASPTPTPKPGPGQLWFDGYGTCWGASNAECCSSWNTYVQTSTDATLISSGPSADTCLRFKVGTSWYYVTSGRGNCPVGGYNFFYSPTGKPPWTKVTDGTKVSIPNTDVSDPPLVENPTACQ